MAGLCQCRDCQQASGSGHAAQMAFPRDAVRLTGQASPWDKPANSGNIVTRAFCPKCGSPVYSTNAAMPTLFFIRATSLDDPGRYRPQMVVWAARGRAWDHTDPALPKFDRMPPM
ncbi:MAG: GFA family protein [Acetobacteraceae bacterium]